MRSLADIIQKHQIPGVRLSEIREVCAKTAGALTKYAIAPKNVRYKEGKLFFSIPSVIKAELLLREDDFKRALKTAGVEVSEVR